VHNQPSCHEDNENLCLTIDSVRGLLLLHQGDNVQLQESGEWFESSSTLRVCSLTNLTLRFLCWYRAIITDDRILSVGH